MPFTLHADLLFIQYFPYFLSHRGIWDVYGYFGDHYLKFGFTYYAPLVYFVTAFFQWLVSGFFVNFPAWFEKMHPLFYSHDPAALPAYLPALSKPQIYLSIFWMKFPYLLMEAACILFLAGLVDERSQRLNAVSLWIWNPVLIIAVYVIGQYRLLPAMLLLAVLSAMKGGRKNAAAFFYGLLCLTDNFPLVLFPFFLIICGDDLRQRMKIGLVSLVTAGVVLAPLSISSHGSVLSVYFSPLIRKVSSSGIFRGQPAALGLILKSFFLATIFAVAVALVKQSRLHRLAANKDRVRYFSAAGLVTLLAWYAVSPVMIHYFVWCLPFFTLLWAWQELPWDRRLSVLMMALLLFFNLDSREMNAGLLVPVLGERALSLPSLHEIMAPYLPWGKAVALARALFSGLCIYFVWRLYEKIRTV